jgi:metal-responsive CopG/Arc/MetJ family transcriptional regulator
MATPNKRASHVFTISFPQELANQVVAVAHEESRTISELFREAFRTYRKKAAVNTAQGSDARPTKSAEDRVKPNSRS